MDGWMDESHKKASRKTTTTSFTICNGNIFVEVFNKAAKNLSWLS